MKTITTGDGGMIFCTNKQDENTLRNNIFLGMNENSSTLSKSKTSENWWIIEPKTFGTRNIMNNISASLGISQLKKLDDFIEKQNWIWDQYLQNIKNNWISFPDSPKENTKEAGYFFWIYSKHRDKIANYLKKHGIFSTFRYYPLHKTKLYSNTQSLPNTDNFYETALCIPCHKNLSKPQINYIISKINEFNPL
jgi:aminotransferase